METGQDMITSIELCEEDTCDGNRSRHDYKH